MVKLKIQLIRTSKIRVSDQSRSVCFVRAVVVCSCGHLSGSGSERGREREKDRELSFHALWRGHGTLIRSLK